MVLDRDVRRLIRRWGGRPIYRFFERYASWLERFEAGFYDQDQRLIEDRLLERRPLKNVRL